MTAYRWTRAAPGLYYLWDGPHAAPRTQAIAKIDRMEGGRYRLKMLQDGAPQPEKATGRWTPHTAMAALEAHIGMPGDTFTPPRF